MYRMLLSINPEFVNEIFSGRKRYEFRKAKCKEDVQMMLIYETSPIMQVVGQARIEDVIIGHPKEVWKKTSSHAGISKHFFDLYFQGRKKAVAYKLADVQKFDRPLPLSHFGIDHAPQSFQYVAES